MFELRYPANLLLQADGNVLVTFPDWPEALTEGEGYGEALEQAADCLEEAVASRIAHHQSIPAAAEPQDDQVMVAVPINTASKAILWRAIQDSGLSSLSLAPLIGMDEREVEHLLDPRGPSDLSRIEGALVGLGSEVSVIVREKVQLPFPNHSQDTVPTAQ